MKAMAEKGRSPARKLTVGTLPCKGRAWAKNRLNYGRFARSVKAVILTIFRLPALNFRDGFCPRFRRETEPMRGGCGKNTWWLDPPNQGLEFPKSYHTQPVEGNSNTSPGILSSVTPWSQSSRSYSSGW